MSEARGRGGPEPAADRDDAAEPQSNHPTGSAFRAAVEARDLDAVVALLADDVVFTSPVAFRPYTGKAITAAILRAVFEVFEEFHYVRELADDDGHALVFEAKVDGLALTGCDFLRHDADGKVTALIVMVRPLRAAEALAARMGERFEQIAAEAAATPAPPRSG